jgi:hypothetical protein
VKETRKMDEVKTLMNQKCYEILMDDNMIAPRHDEKLDPKTDVDAICARAQNAKAYMLLSLSISPSDTVSFGAVQNATTEEIAYWRCQKGMEKYLPD